MNNYYDEYLYVNGRWELIGSTQVDLSNYYTKSEADNKFAESSSLASVATSGSYSDLTDAPSIESVPLSGNKTFMDLNIDEATIEEANIKIQPHEFQRGCYDFSSLSVGDELPALDTQTYYRSLILNTQNLTTHSFLVTGYVPTAPIGVFLGRYEYDSATQTSRYVYRAEQIYTNFGDEYLTNQEVEIEFVANSNRVIVFNFQRDHISEPVIYLKDVAIKMSDFAFNFGGETRNETVLDSLTVGERPIETTVGTNSITNGTSKATGTNSVAFGEAVSTGTGSLAVGRSSATGDYSTAEGNGQASGQYSHAEGSGKAIGICSHAEGYGGTIGATGNYSHAEGSGNASGDNAHGEGSGSASGKWSHAEGRVTSASGEGSHSEGYNTFAYGDYSHVEGNNSYAYHNAENAHVEGLGCMSDIPNQHVQGKYNISDVNGDYAHIVGAGIDMNNNRNIHTLSWGGQAWFQGNVYVGSTTPGNKDAGSKKLATEDYVNANTGDINTIESISVNGTTQTPDANKNVDITVPQITYSTTDLTPGTSTLTTGTFYFVYE